eukprot:10226452-Lingulodinium_polyedra.AAC.1
MRSELLARAALPMTAAATEFPISTPEQELAQGGPVLPPPNALAPSSAATTLGARAKVLPGPTGPR